MKKKFFENYSIVFTLFMFGSFLGFILENLLTLIRGKYELRQGLIYEPLIPVYGIGLLIFYLAYKNISFKKDNIFLNVLKSFLIGLIVGSITEYACSFLQEKIFGTVSWNYSKHRFNLNGRICLKYSVYWGMAGLMVYTVFMPLIEKIKKHAFRKEMKMAVIIFSVTFLADVLISSLACIRKFERTFENKPSNEIEAFLDKHYPDKYLNKIYNNAKIVKQQNKS